MTPHARVNRVTDPRGHWQTIYDAGLPARMEWVWDVEPTEEWFQRELERQRQAAREERKVTR